jgi:hypothetical protein
MTTSTHEKKKAARREPDGNRNNTYAGNIARLGASGKLVIEWGERTFVFSIDPDGNPKIREIDENTRWRIYKGADGQLVVEMLEDERKEKVG